MIKFQDGIKAELPSSEQQVRKRAICEKLTKIKELKMKSDLKEIGSDNNHK